MESRNNNAHVNSLIYRSQVGDPHIPAITVDTNLYHVLISLLDRADSLRTKIVSTCPIG